MANKNSLYIGSLTSFILDTKPYHSKLTEVQEIYQFYDEMTVHFEESLFTRLMLKAAWPYSYYSGGNAFSVPGVGQPMSLHQLVSPLMRGTASGETSNNSPDNRGAFKALRDENTDLPLVPFAFDPHQIQGAGLRDAFVQRDGDINLSEPLLEGHDIYLSHGAYVFQIKQTLRTQQPVVGRYNEIWNAGDGPYPVTVTLPFSNADSLLVTGPAVQLSLISIEVTGPGAVVVTGLSNAPNYGPEFTERQKENTIAEATATVQANALDTLNPNSSVNRITAIMNLIAAQLVLTPNAAASAELALVQAILATPLLPNSYEALFEALETGSTPVIAGYTDWRGADTATLTYVDSALSALSPSLYFNTYTDLRNRESGALAYRDIVSNGITITNIANDPIREAYEEWTLTAVNGTTFLVFGSSSGSIGSFTLPNGVFSSPRLGFTYAGPGTVPTGTKIFLTPDAEITVHYEAPLEAWSIIKVNPRAYSRPVFSSTRYGFIRSQTNELNYITINDIGFPSTSLVLTAVSSTTFALTSTAEPTYTATIPVNTAFNDGRLAFTIVTGSAYAFTVGDKFFIDIENKDPEAENLDLYYGYDMDPYDANEMVYSTLVAAFDQITLDFGYDSRFIGYDLTSFGLTLAPNVMPNRRWRLRANPNFAMPVPLHPITSPATQVNQVNLIATNDPTNPAAPIQVDMVNDVTSEGIQSSSDPVVQANLELWYATDFELEYYDEGLTTWVSVDTIPINAPYTNATHGLSFTVVEAGKPFIAAVLHSSWYNLTGPVNVETVEGGDVIAWTTLNEPPRQLEPASLSSSRGPRLIMYGDSYHFATPAIWSLTFTGAGVYDLQGIRTSGAQNGQMVFGAPISVSISADGRSYKNNLHGLHFTVVEGNAGLAANDTFTFNTFVQKPTYLVHGSVSGWQPDAEAGVWYWNGKIGFKIAAAKAYLFDGVSSLQIGLDSPWIAGTGVVTLNRLRPDAASSEYRMVSHVSGHWTMYRRGAVVAEGANTLGDKYLNVTMPTSPAGTVYIISVQGQDRPLSLGHDLAIIRTSITRSPTGNDFALLERTTSDTLSISITPKDPAHSVALLALAPVNITNVDHFVMNGFGSGGEVPLSVTSPETAILQGWIPVLETRYDRATSVAEFSDPQDRVVVRSAATGETIGEVLSLSTNPAEPVIFRWDPAFHDAYLPLNAEANIVTLGGGWNDRVNVNMTDNAVFLISGGGLADDMLFAEYVNVNIVDTSLLSILSNYEESTGIVISDGPFVGFLPGYDNMPFDYETGTGNVNDENAPSAYYDAGVPLTDWFQQAQGLSLLPSLTAPQQALLNDLLGLVGPWLDGDILTTTFAEFVINIGANPPDPALYNNPLNWTPVPNFGIPAVGMGMQIETSSTASAATEVRESASIGINEFGYAFDSTGYDLGEMDAAPERSVALFSSTADAQQYVLALSSTYATFDAALFVPNAQIIEINFTDVNVLALPVGTPAVYLWRPTDALPTRVPIVEKLSARRFRFSVASPTELKVMIG